MGLVEKFESDGVTGLGEGAPIKRYGETAQGALAVLSDSKLQTLFADADPWKHQALLAELSARVPGAFP